MYHFLVNSGLLTLEWTLHRVNSVRPTMTEQRAFTPSVILLNNAW